MKTARELRETTPILFTASSNDFRNTELHAGTDEDLIIRRWLMGRGVDEDELCLKQRGQYQRDTVFLCIQWTLLNFSTGT